MCGIYEISQDVEQSSPCEVGRIELHAWGTRVYTTVHQEKEGKENLLLMCVCVWLRGLGF